MNSADTQKYKNQNKWIVAGLAMLMFIVFASPQIFQLTNKFLTMISSKLATTKSGMEPTWYGLIVHGVLFGLAVRLMMY